MKPFFSVIIPTLNEEKFLPNLLNDLVHQTEKSFEVIVVDGKSVDRTRDIVNGEKRLDIRLAEVKENNVSTQRNAGAHQANGEYLFFIDADSRVNASFIKTAREYIQTSKFLIYLPAMVPDYETAPYPALTTLGNYAVELSQITPKPFSNSGTFFINRHFFHHLGGFDPSLKLAEDHDIIQRARNIGVHAKFLHGLSFTFSLRRFKKEGLFTLLMKYTIGTFYTLTNQRIDKEIYGYEMGGLRYADEDHSQTFDEFKRLYNKVMKTLEKTF